MKDLTKTERMIVVGALLNLACRIGPSVFADVTRIAKKLDCTNELLSEGEALVEYAKNHKTPTAG